MGTSTGRPLIRPAIRVWASARISKHMPCVLGVVVVGLPQVRVVKATPDSPARSHWLKA